MVCGWVVSLSFSFPDSFPTFLTGKTCQNIILLLYTERGEMYSHNWRDTNCREMFTLLSFEKANRPHFSWQSCLFSLKGNLGGSAALSLSLYCDVLVITVFPTVSLNHFSFSLCSSVSVSVQFCICNVCFSFL